jgi:glutathione S-transferase
MIRVTGFRWVPPFAQGYVRDLRVRWALEEAGLPYEVRLIGPEDQASAAYRAQQPFGQVPVYEEDGLTLFESGAIVLHVGEKSAVLMPEDPVGRARATAWVLAALNSVEIYVGQLAEIVLFHKGEEWAEARRPAVEAAVRRRLAEVEAALGARDWLEDRFTVGDLMMGTVLRDLGHSTLVEERLQLRAYLDRCLSRPAFGRAHDGQMAAFAA